ncbi:MAG: glycosyltransferase family A protein [Solirubrobacteraceae bacterium]
MAAAVAVVVPARNAQATLGAALDGLAAQRGAPEAEFVVVDNASSDGTGALAAAHPLRPRIVRRDAPGGPGVARNAGVAATAAPLVAFTDADCVPDPGWLASGVAALAGADLVQGAVSPPPGETVGPFDRSLWVSGDNGLYQTANLFVTRAGFDAVGGFEDWLDAPRPFGEDTLLAWRLRRGGARAAFCPQAVVRHAVLPGTVAQHLAERRRDALFAQLVRHVPELREAALYRRVFLGRRAALCDLALAGALAANARRSAGPLTLAAPYALEVAKDARAWRSARVAGVHAAGDVIGAGARLAGSARWGTVVL